MKKILTILVIVVLIIILLNFNQLSNFKTNKDANDDLILENISFGDITLNLTDKDFEISYGQLIAVIGKSILNWNLETFNNDQWYINYVRLAKEKGLIDNSLSGYKSRLTLKESMKIFVSALELKGEKNYPIIMDIYESKVSEYIDKKDVSFSHIVKAYYHGILPSNLTEVDFNKNLSSKYTYTILKNIINHSNRNFPFIIDNEVAKHISIDNHTFPVGIFYANDKLLVQTKISNNSDKNQSYWYGLSYKDPIGNWYDVSAKEIAINPNESNKVTLEWLTPKELISGRYHIVCSLWDGKPNIESSNRIAHFESGNTLYLYNYQDNFESFDKSLWKSSTFKLGRTSFLPKNVTVSDGNLVINMPKNTYGSGEIQSIDLKSFGSYEIRMKLPDAKGSITGFFMYKSPDYYHEIDIEIYNDTTRDYFLTTYSDGKVQNEFLSTLQFDARKSFNNYRFDYYPDRLEYYINDIYITSFDSGYSLSPMHLILNCWYPNWLDDGPSKEDVNLIVEWIRY